jgi:hypothetical protein
MRTMTNLLGVAWENIVVGLLSGLLVFLMLD